MPGRTSWQLCASASRMSSRARCVAERGLHACCACVSTGRAAKARRPRPHACVRHSLPFAAIGAGSGNFQRAGGRGACQPQGLWYRVATGRTAGFVQVRALGASMGLVGCGGRPMCLQSCAAAGSSTCMHTARAAFPCRACVRTKWKASTTCMPVVGMHAQPSMRALPRPAHCRDQSTKRHAPVYESLVRGSMHTCMHAAHACGMCECSHAHGAALSKKKAGK